MKGGVREWVLGFLHSNTGSTENSPLHVTTTRPNQRKSATNGSTIPSCTEGEKPTIKMYSHNRVMFFQVWPTIAVHGRSCNNFVAFAAEVYRNMSSPKLRNFLQHFPANT
jgi:hypothetical protein